jgi:hypothetical protein
MEHSWQGRCQCGEVRYRLDVEPSGLSVCHCRGCQRQSGSAFGLNLDIPKEAFRLLSGDLKTFSVLCESGQTKDCAFCPHCGTRIYHSGEWGMSIKAGTLDETSSLEPVAHYWTKQRQAWVQIPDGVSCFTDDG